MRSLFISYSLNYIFVSAARFSSIISVCFFRSVSTFQAFDIVALLSSLFRISFICFCFCFFLFQFLIVVFFQSLSTPHTAQTLHTSIDISIWTQATRTQIQQKDESLKPSIVTAFDSILLFHMRIASRLVRRVCWLNDHIFACLSSIRQFFLSWFRFGQTLN